MVTRWLVCIILERPDDVIYLGQAIDLAFYYRKETSKFCTNDFTDIIINYGFRVNMHVCRVQMHLYAFTARHIRKTYPRKKYAIESP